ncbi:hypothetical protein [Hwanghaeella grinnelliae]|nr:hypothetical protein [Hwanghaeella grinnelliae]
MVTGTRGGLDHGGGIAHAVPIDVTLDKVDQDAAEERKSKD